MERANAIKKFIMFSCIIVIAIAMFGSVPLYEENTSKMAVHKECVQSFSKGRHQNMDASHEMTGQNSRALNRVIQLKKNGAVLLKIEIVLVLLAALICAGSMEGYRRYFRYYIRTYLPKNLVIICYIAKSDGRKRGLRSS